MGRPTAYQQDLAQTALNLGRIEALRMVTLTVNDHELRRPEQAMHLLRRDLRRWLAQIDRRLLGKHYARLPAHRRLDGLFAAEKLDVHPHLHGVVRLPEDRLDVDLQNVGEKLWRGIVPAGEFRAQIIGSIGGAAYPFKDQGPSSEIIFARDFHPAS